MKTSLPAIFCCILFWVTCVMPSCKQPAKNKVQQQKVLQKLDKATLLKMVGALADTLSRKGIKATDGLKLLQGYAANYDFIINGHPKHHPDTGYVFVNITDGKSVDWFSFGLPQSLQKQITFTDLKNSFGPWRVDPLPKEPVSISSTFDFKSAGNVYINVNSENLPEAKVNRIEEISVMCSTHE